VRDFEVRIALKWAGNRTYLQQHNEFQLVDTVFIMIQNVPLIAQHLSSSKKRNAVTCCDHQDKNFPGSNCGSSSGSMKLLCEAEGRDWQVQDSRVALCTGIGGQASRNSHCVRQTKLQE
jgi:hypothetical protein